MCHYAEIARKQANERGHCGAGHLPDLIFEGSSVIQRAWRTCVRRLELAAHTPVRAVWRR
jgi:hypothetical protein